METPAQLPRPGLKTHVTLTRKQAAIKLESATRVQWYFQRGEGQRYEREVTVREVVQFFRADTRARLRIRLEDSQHTITVVDNADLKIGYVVEFS